MLIFLRLSLKEMLKDIDILLLAYTGMRIGEALALRVADVDLRRRRITVGRLPLPSWRSPPDYAGAAGRPRHNRRGREALPRHGSPGAAYSVSLAYTWRFSLSALSGM